MRAAAERRHHDRAFRAAIAEQQAGRVPLTEAEQRRTFARVVLAALPPLVERTRALCRQALDRDRDDSRGRRVILGQARRARRPRDQTRAPPTRRTRPAATSTGAATTTGAPAPGRPPRPHPIRATHRGGPRTHCRLTPRLARWLRGGSGAGEALFGP